MAKHDRVCCCAATLSPASKVEPHPSALCDQVFGCQQQAHHIASSPSGGITLLAAEHLNPSASSRVVAALFTSLLQPFLQSQVSSVCCAVTPARFAGTGFALLKPRDLFLFAVCCRLQLQGEVLL